MSIFAKVKKLSHRKIELKYTFEIEDDFYVGYLDNYPEFPTQGEDMKDFEANLIDIYEMIQDGTLNAQQKHGVLEIAV
jgi:molecular chaperone GrpE (heat shock protein)